MNGLSTGRQYASVGVPLAALLGWLLQARPDSNPGVGSDVFVGNLLVNAIGAAVWTLIVGGLLVALATDYTNRNTNRIIRNPGRTFAYGFGLFIALIVAVVVLAITIVGIFIAIPLLIIAAILFGIWGELGYLAIGRIVVDDKWQALGVAVGFAFLAGIVPIVGGLVAFVVASMGVGAGFIDFREDDPPRQQGQQRPGPRPDRHGGRGGRGGGGRPPQDAGAQPRDDRQTGRRGGPQRTDDRPRGGQAGGQGGSYGAAGGGPSESDSGWGFDDEESGEGGSDSEWGFDDDETWGDTTEDEDWSTTDEDVEWSSDEEDEDSGFF